MIDFIILVVLVGYLVIAAKTMRSEARKQWILHERRYPSLDPKSSMGEFVAEGLIRGLIWPAVGIVRLARRVAIRFAFGDKV